MLVSAAAVVGCMHVFQSFGSIVRTVFPSLLRISCTDVRFLDHAAVGDALGDERHLQRRGEHVALTDAGEREAGLVRARRSGPTLCLAPRARGRSAARSSMPHCCIAGGNRSPSS